MTLIVSDRHRGSLSMQYVAQLYSTTHLIVRTEDLHDRIPQLNLEIQVDLKCSS